MSYNGSKMSANAVLRGFWEKLRAEVVHLWNGHTLGALLWRGAVDVGCEKRNNPGKRLRGVWLVYECFYCGESVLKKPPENSLE